MTFKTGKIYHFTPCRASIPEKNKYAICVSGKNNWFYLINSCSDTLPIRPYNYEAGMVVVLNSFQTPPLNRKSYINVSKLRTITDIDFDSCREYDAVSNQIWLTIKKLCMEKLPAKYCEVISAEKI